MAMISTQVTVAAVFASCLFLPAILAGQREAPHPQPGNQVDRRTVSTGGSTGARGKNAHPTHMAGKSPRCRLSEL